MNIVMRCTLILAFAVAPSAAALAQAYPSKPVRIIIPTFSSAGIGTSPHMMMELLKWMAGLDMVHVPYKGLAVAILDQI